MTDHDLDRLIDTALPAYLVEPAPGLAARVEARVKRRRLVWLPLAGAAAAAALVAFAWWPRAAIDLPVQQTPAIERAATQRFLPERPALPDRVAVAVIQRSRARQVNPIVRPVPLSLQELRLAQFVTQHPELAQQVLPRESQGQVEPLSAPEPLVIRPLGSE